MKVGIVGTCGIPENYSGFETFGLTIIEAMVYGIPVILAPVGGC